MSINIRQKGATAEQDIALELNAIICGVHMELGIPVPAKPIVQRNQMQSAVGGKDLVGTFGLAIEVKRQESLSIGSWWAQCTTSAKDLGEVPVLLFRQNKQKWRCIMQVQIPITDGSYVQSKAEISFEDFKLVFKRLVLRQYSAGKAPQVDHPTLFP